MRKERACWALGTVWRRTVCPLDLGGLGMVMKWHLGQVSASHFTTAKYSLEAWVDLGENNWLPLIVRSRNQTDYYEGINWKAPESLSVATLIFNHLCIVLSRFSHIRLWDCSLPGSSVHGILQARIFFSHVCCAVLSHSVMPSCLQPGTVACQAPLSMGIFQVRMLELVAMPSLPWDLPNPGIETRSPALLVDSLLSELPGKSKNTGVGSLSFLQGNFPTQESNWGLLHRRQILNNTSRQINNEDKGSVKIYLNYAFKKNCLSFIPSKRL